MTIDLPSTIAVIVLYPVMCYFKYIVSRVNIIFFNNGREIMAKPCETCKKMGWAQYIFAWYIRENQNIYNSLLDIYAKKNSEALVYEINAYHF